MFGKYEKFGKLNETTVSAGLTKQRLSIRWVYLENVDQALALFYSRYTAVVYS